MKTKAFLNKAILLLLLLLFVSNYEILAVLAFIDVIGLDIFLILVQLQATWWVFKVLIPHALSALRFLENFSAQAFCLPTLPQLRSHPATAGYLLHREALLFLMALSILLGSASTLLIGWFTA